MRDRETGPDDNAGDDGSDDDWAIEAATSHSALGRALRLGAKLGVAGILITGIVGSVSLLHLRAELRSEPDAVAPLEVAVVEMTLQSSYPLQQRFAGRLEARRSTVMAFERGGLLTEVLVEEGEAITAGQVVATLDIAPLAARRNELEAEREVLLARLELARITTERQRKLAKQGNASKQRFDEARLEAEAVQAQVLSIDAALTQLDIDIAKSSLTAPYAGRIAARNSDEGSILAAGSPVVMLMESDVLEARIGLNPAAAASLESGESYRLDVDGRAVAARLVALRPDMAGGTRTIAALFRIEGAEQFFLGDLAVLSLEKAVPQSGYWVPLTALVAAPKGLWTLYTAQPDGQGGHQVALEAVVVHHVHAEQAYVSGSLTEGAQVIMAGPHRVAPGQSVTPIPHRPVAPSATPEAAASEALVLFTAPNLPLSTGTTSSSNTRR